MAIKALLRQWELTPHKGLGQNFLVDQRVLEQILTAGEINAADTVLEIGPGLGTLTLALAERAKRVVAVELDQQLVAILNKRLQTFPNVQVVGGDILALCISELMAAAQASDPTKGGASDPTKGGASGPTRGGASDPTRGGASDLAGPAYKVVANIPYNITSAVLRHLLETRARPELIVLMVQKEVAQRITAKPGDMSLLSVSVQFYGQPRLVQHVPARAFYPVPKVDSAIIRIDPHPQLSLAPDEVEPFFAVVRAGFGQRRKQVRNSLSHGLGLSVERAAEALAQAGVDAERRAQTLSIAEWVTLYRALRGVV